MDTDGGSGGVCMFARAVMPYNLNPFPILYLCLSVSICGQPQKTFFIHGCGEFLCVSRGTCFELFFSSTDEHRWTQMGEVVVFVCLCELLCQ
jgi:hypothetical protein